MADPFDTLFKALRESCTPAVWSKGVELARQSLVAGEKDEGGTLELRVRQASGGVSQVATLNLEDEEWLCTCSGDDDPCAHVAAAAIAVRRAREAGEALPRASVAAGGTIGYRLSRRREGEKTWLIVERRFVLEGREAPFLGTAAAIAAGKPSSPLPFPVAVASADLEIEMALRDARGGAPPIAAMAGVLSALRSASALSLDGSPVRLDPTPVGPRITVEEDGPGVRLALVEYPGARERFANGAVLVGDVLHPAQRYELTPPEQEMLAKRRLFVPGEFGFLVAEVIPALEAKLPVEVRTAALPRRTSGKPRLELELTKTDGEGMAVQPAIVYGEPMTARVVRGWLHTFGNTAPVRDLDLERKLADELTRKFGFGLDERPVYPAREAVALAARLARDAAGASITGDGVRQFALSAPLQAQVELGKTLEVRFSSAGSAPAGRFGSEDLAGAKSGAVATASASRVLAAWRAGESLVSLDGGAGFAPLPLDWLSRYGARVLELLDARELGGALPAALAPAAVELAEDLGIAVPPALAGLRERLLHFERLPPPRVPADLVATLRPYQRDGLAWLQFLRTERFGALLADDMGLGKTLQAIAAIEGKTLVVAPTSVLPNWLAELQRFRPGLTVESYHGGGRALDPKAQVTVTTYAVMRLDVERLAALPWDMIVLDEAQTIKNPQSQTARAAFRLEARFKVTLSGTPVENRLDDLYSQMRFLNAGLLGDARVFQELYARPMEQGGALAEEAATRLKRRIKPFVLRRLKRDVAPELPPLTEIVLHAELSPSERERYEAVRLATRAEVIAQLGAGGNTLAALEALLRLRQAACHPDLLPGVSGESSAKLELLVDRLGESVANGHKALVFSQWTSFLDLVEPALTAAGLSFSRLDGTTVDREAVVREFQAEGGPPVLLMSLKAGGVGLNLTAADHVFMLDPWWNPAVEDQATARAHRIGQEQPVLVQRLVTKDSVEERILVLQEKKRALAAAAVDSGSAAGGATLTKDDLLALLD